MSVDDGLFDGEVDEAVDLIMEFTEGGRTGGRLYAGLAEQLGGQQSASEFMRNLGIPGIKYFDGGSRAAGEGTRNFVVFDDSIVKILKRNGEELTKKEKAEAVAEMNKAAGAK